MTKIRFLLTALVISLLLVSCGSQGEKRTDREGGPGGEKERPEEDPAERLARKLEDFIRFEEVLPQMALSDEQKTDIVPLVEEWLEGEKSGEEYGREEILAGITALLTPEQQEYSPVPEEGGFPAGDNRPEPPDGKAGAGGRPSGPPPGGAPPNGAPPENQPGPEREGQGRKDLAPRLERLLLLLTGEGDDPPAPPSAG